MQRDVGAHLVEVSGIYPVEQTAGATAEVEGPIYDRSRLEEMILSCVCYAAVTAVLAQDETLSLAVEIYHGDEDDMSDEALFAELTALEATGGTGGSTEQVDGYLDIDLSGAKRYVRVKAEPTLSAVDTDTATFSSVLVFGGITPLPSDGDLAV
jgi:hypothetical protein